MARQGSPRVAAFDFLIVLVSFFLIIALLESPATPAIHTYGVMAVTTKWQTEDDVDLYMRNPQGQIVYFASPSGGLMYLEHDTIPLTTDLVSGHKTAVKGEHERVIITGVIPGEYTINIMMYNKAVSRPCVVTVQVWSLQGQDKLLLTVTVVLHRSDDERTALRITLSTAGRIIQVSHVQTSLLIAALSGGSSPQISGGNDTRPPGRP